MGIHLAARKWSHRCGGCPKLCGDWQRRRRRRAHRGLRCRAQHARVDVRADGVYLEDLDSPGGTFVGGVRARRMGIAHGDVVRFGNQLAVFAERGLSNCEGQLDLAEEIVIGPRDRAAFVEPALEYARAGQSFAIEGGPASANEPSRSSPRVNAKRVARCWSSTASPRPPIVFAEAQGERPKTFLLLSAERLTRPLQTEIVQMLARAPGAIAIATFDISLDRAVGDGLVAPSFATLTNSRKLVVPPLSARRENIPGIVRALARKLHIDPSRLSVEFIERLVRADWPAGIPEIEEVLRETAATSEGVLDATSISRPLTRPPSSYPSPPAADDPALARERLVDALAKAGGSIASAARTLGMSRQAVYREAQRLGLELGTPALTREEPLSRKTPSRRG